MDKGVGLNFCHEDGDQDDDHREERRQRHGPSCARLASARVVFDEKRNAFEGKDLVVGLELHGGVPFPLARGGRSAGYPNPTRVANGATPLTETPS